MNLPTRQPLHKAVESSASPLRKGRGQGVRGVSGLCKVLIIGYGNTLRSDDGVGPKAADAVSELNLAGVEAMACAQLTPELAEPISRASLVIFVDAALDAPREVQLRKLVPADSSQIFAHAADPRTMLALSRDVFGHAPAAWWLTIPIANTGIGEELSPMAQGGLKRAIEKIKELATRTPSWQFVKFVSGLRWSEMPPR